MIEDEFKVTFNKFKIEEETKFYMDYNDFNNLVSEHLPTLTNTSERYKDFECVAEFEWNNYSNYDAEVEEADFKEDSIYYAFERQDIIEKKNYLNFQALLCFLVEHKILPYGKYEVKVSW